MKVWACRCGNIRLADKKPEPKMWDDGHVCNHEEKELCPKCCSVMSLDGDSNLCCLACGHKLVKQEVV